MTSPFLKLDPAVVHANVQAALLEDLGEPRLDVTALLINAEEVCSAVIITREPMVLAGSAWAEAAFQALDPEVELSWQLKEGEQAEPNQALLHIKGNARAMMSAERTAMNFLQTLSAVATLTHKLSSLIKDYKCKLLDTRKTLPGLRMAQKYAVSVGGGTNHRIGLFDAFLIKENHIAACGSIEAAVKQARALYPDLKLEVEVETFEELDLAVAAGADVVMLDNFSVEQMKTAAKRVAGQVKLEASGNVSESTLVQIAQTGVDFISMGALTKSVAAVDLSMRVQSA